MRAQAILETCLYVTDLAAAEQFYTTVLGLEFVERQAGRHVFLRCGRQMFLLFDPHACAQPQGQFPTHGALGAGHVAFAATATELVDWEAWLAERGVPLERVVNWPQGGRSLYFRDPAGNSVELATPRLWGLSDAVPP